MVSGAHLFHGLSRQNLCVGEVGANVFKLSPPSFTYVTEMRRRSVMIRGQSRSILRAYNATTQYFFMYQTSTNEGGNVVLTGNGQKTVPIQFTKPPDNSPVTVTYKVRYIKNGAEALLRMRQR